MDGNGVNSGDIYERTFAGKAGGDGNKEESAAKRPARLPAGVIQSLICLAVIGAIVLMKSTAPGAFSAVSSSLGGLYSENVTLADLNKLLNEKILGSGAVSVFFNMSGRQDFEAEDK